MFFPSKYTYFDKELYVSKLKRRSRSLLIPYLIWNLIAYLLYAINTKFNIFDFFRAFWIIDIPGRGGSSPIDGPLWYVRDLMLLMLASPIIYRFIKHKTIIILLLILWFIGIYPFNKGLFISFTFFSLGGFLRYESYNVTKIHGYWFYIFYFVLFFALPHIQDNFFPYAKRIMIMTGIMTILSIAKKMPNFDGIIYSKLSSATFFIYCCHAILLRYLKPIAQNISTAWWAYLLLIATDIAGCLLLFFIVTKLFPKYSKLLTGGR